MQLKQIVMPILMVLLLLPYVIPAVNAVPVTQEPSPELGDSSVTLPAEDTEDGTVTPPAEDTDDGDAPILGGGIGMPPIETPESSSYTETLENFHIKDGEIVSYTTISSEFSGWPNLDGYYPGELTVNITGQVVVEAGGTLSIGTISVGGSEASPVLSWQSGAQIIVKAGGQLKLTDVEFQGAGNTPVIIQEPGGSVELTATTVETGWIQWSSPLVYNLYTQPDDLWLETGTPLTADGLPRSLAVDVQTEGITQVAELTLEWNLEEYDGRTDGEYCLTGRFLDEAGQPLCSLLPLELAVHWYTPETLVVTSAEWKGNTVPLAELTVPQLPADAQVWGEVSVDNGITWERWDTEDVFFTVEIESEGFACIFVLPDQTPRLFRIAAEDPWEHGYWRSEAFALAPADEDDSGGNRGGSTTPVPPDREPTLPEESLPEEVLPEEALPQETVPEVLPEAPAPESTVETPQIPESVQQPVSQTTVTQEPAIAPSQTEETTDLPETQPAVSVDAAAEPDVSTPLPQEPAVNMDTIPTSNTAPAMSLPLQGLLVAAGLALCVGIAMAITHIGPFRRKQ